MLGQAIGLAFVAAWYPPATIVAAHYLGSGIERALSYWAGAVASTFVVGVVVTAVLRGTGITVSQRVPPGVTKIVVGGVLVITAAVLRVRALRQRRGTETRVFSNRGLTGAFVLGVVMYSPSLAYLAALERLSAWHVNPVFHVTALALLVAIVAAMPLAPIVGYVVAPNRIGPIVTRFNLWVNRHMSATGPVILAVAGVIVLALGITEVPDPGGALRTKPG
jgi:hypothetical protein